MVRTLKPLMLSMYSMKGILLDDIRISEILLVDPETIVRDLMDNRLISLQANDPQEEVS